MDIAEIRKKAKQMEAAKEAALKDLTAKDDKAEGKGPRAVSVDEASLDIVTPPPPRPAPEVSSAPEAEDDFIIDDTPEALAAVAAAAPLAEGAPLDESADFIMDDAVAVEAPKAEAVIEEVDDYLIDDTAEPLVPATAAQAEPEAMEDYIIDDTAEASAVASVPAPQAEAVLQAGADVTADAAPEAVPAEAEDDTGEDIEAITFIIGKEVYAIDILDIREIIKTKDLTDVPRSPDVVLGVLSLRGTVVPVMDLPRALNIKGYVQPSFMDEIGISHERVIIVRDGEELMGFKVDAIEGVVRVPRKTLEPPPLVDSLDAEMIHAIGRCEGKPFILLAVDKVLSRV